jgi:hypothetical protein
MRIKKETITKYQEQVKGFIDKGDFKSALDIASRYPLDFVICKTRLMKQYKVCQEDLIKLNVIEKKNPHYTSAPPMKLYLEAEVKSLFQLKEEIG